MGTSKIGDDREKRNVFSGFLGDFSGGLEGTVVHGGVDTDNDIGFVGFQALLDATPAGYPGMNVRTDFVEFSVGQVVKDFPFERIRRHALVGIDEGSVWKNSVVRPQIGQFIGRSGILNQKLKCIQKSQIQKLYTPWPAAVRRLSRIDFIRFPFE